jgi:hypothetical protein
VDEDGYRYRMAARNAAVNLLLQSLETELPELRAPAAVNQLTQGPEAELPESRAAGPVIYWKAGAVSERQRRALMLTALPS